MDRVPGSENVVEKWVLGLQHIFFCVCKQAYGLSYVFWIRDRTQITSPPRGKGG